jgi:integrase
MLAACAGLRLNEIVSLKWIDIDFATRLIHIARKVSYSTVPLHRHLAEQLLVWKRESAAQGEHVFRGPFARRRLLCALERHCPDTPIQMRFHDFRALLLGSLMSGQGRCAVSWALLGLRSPKWSQRRVWLTLDDLGAIPRRGWLRWRPSEN